MLEQLQQKLQSNGSVRFKVKIIPKSQQSEIVGALGEDTLKIKVAAIAAKNKANQELVKFLSKTFNVPKSNVTIISGPTSPLKVINVQQ